MSPTWVCHVLCADGSEIKFDVQRVITDGQLKEQGRKTFRPALRYTDSLSPKAAYFFHDCPQVAGNPSKLSCLGIGCARLRGLGTGLGFSARNSVKSSSVTYEPSPFCCPHLLKIVDGLLLSNSLFAGWEWPVGSHMGHRPVCANFTLPLSRTWQAKSDLYLFYQMLNF